MCGAPLKNPRPPGRTVRNVLSITAHDILEQLLAKRSAHPSAELEREIGAARVTYVGLAVTDIAMLRAALDGRLEG